MRNQANLIFKIDTFKINKGKILGKGSTGNVYQGYHTQTFAPVAIKAIELKTINNQVTKYLLQAQKIALNTIKNPYVVKGLKVVEDKNFCYMVMEEYSQGTLKDYISKQGKLSSSKALQLFRKILIGYVSIVDNLFIHRDLKTANIMLSYGDPVIIDFGYCEMIMAKRPCIQYNVGSPSYMAPQSYSKSRYSEKSDIWSLGIILYEMLTGKTLDQGKQTKQYFKDMQILGNVGASFNEFPSVCKQILTMALQVNPEKRATVHKLKYVIDKAMIPMMKTQLQKAQSQKMASSVKYIPPKVNIMHKDLTKKGSEKILQMKRQKKQLEETKQTKNASEIEIKKPKPMIIKSLPLPPSPKNKFKPQTRVIKFNTPTQQTKKENPAKANIQFMSFGSTESIGKIPSTTPNGGSMITVKSNPRVVSAMPKIPALQKHVSLPSEDHQQNQYTFSLRII